MVESTPLELQISAPVQGLPERVLARLRDSLGRCPDVAFAHLTELRVQHGAEDANLVLFVWLQGAAMGSLRAALNYVSEQVASALPADRFVDVVILNSAPELLEQVEAAGCLLLERDPEERRRALCAAHSGEHLPESSPVRWWWPF